MRCCSSLKCRLLLSRLAHITARHRRPGPRPIWCCIQCTAGNGTDHAQFPPLQLFRCSACSVTSTAQRVSQERLPNANRKPPNLTFDSTACVGLRARRNSASIDFDQLCFLDSAKYRLGSKARGCSIGAPTLVLFGKICDSYGAAARPRNCGGSLERGGCAYSRR
jgi:hypothetical protein